jgi:hypothetical protein
MNKDDWISVEDRLPIENGEDVLIYCPDTKEKFLAIMQDGCWFSDGWIINGVTHWMPLQEPQE